MAAHQARRRRRRGGTAGVARTHILLARLGQRFLDQFVDEEPGAVVAWFFLRPDDLLELRRPLQTNRARLTREGIELIDADHRRIRQARRVARSPQVVTDLARPEDDKLEVLKSDRTSA